MEISIRKSSDESNHICDSYRDGKWIIYHCKSCPDYERRISWETGAVTVKGSNPSIQHCGQHIPAEYMHALTASN